MKLVIFTPAVKTSAIGRMSCLVTHALVSEGHEVTVVRTENESCLDKPTHNFKTELIVWSDIRRINGQAAKADASIYQIGDNYTFHRGCLEWLPKLPGVICLHDFYLGHLFFEWAQTRREQADAELRAWYGVDVANRFFNYQDGDRFIEGTRETSPMTEWVCSMATGVVTHSNWAIDRVLKSCPGPVYVVPLPYDAPKTKSSNLEATCSDSSQFRILTVGHANTNKRIASVIQAIGKSPMLRSRSIYRLVGFIQPEIATALADLATQNGIKLEISGEIDNDALNFAYQEADVVSCLRWPSLEAASASAIEAMLYGKPTIVTDIGFYREIPDLFVMKVDPGREVQCLQTILENLCENSELRRLLGARAQTWARSTFSPENYARSLIEICKSSNRAKPAVDAVNYFSALLRNWGAEEISLI